MKPKQAKLKSYFLCYMREVAVLGRPRAFGYRECSLEGLRVLVLGVCLLGFCDLHAGFSFLLGLGSCGISRVSA